GPIRSGGVVGRLARGVSVDAARAELLARWPTIQSATLPSTLPEPEREALLRQRLDAAPLVSGFSALRDRYGTTLWVLLALIGILLAVACANLAGLTLARSLTRRHQVAIRLALGGSPWRVFWQLLVDGILLSTVAFAGALPLAWGIIRVVTASLVGSRGPARFPSVTPDAGVIAATALLTMGIGLAIGVVSAWQSVAVRVDEGLRPGRGVIGSLGPFGRGLLVAQVALTMTLLVGAGLFTTTLAHLRANDTSLQSQRIVFARAFRPPGDREMLPPGYYQALVTELARVPGADAAALSVYYPTYFGLKVAVPTDYHYTRADGVTPLDGTVLTDFVSPGFFDLFRFHLLKGRDVSWDDGLGKPAVALISASLARAVFPAGDEIGQQIRIAGPDRRDVEVIGVVADAPYVKLDDPTPLVVFRPIMQETARTQFPMAYVRAKGDLATVRDGYTRVIKSLGHRSLRAFITSSEWVDGVLVQERFTAALATFAAAVPSFTHDSRDGCPPSLLWAAVDIPQHALDPSVDQFLQLWSQLRAIRKPAEPPPQRAGLDQVLDNHDPDEVLILVAKRDQFACREIVRLDTPSGLVASVVVANGDHPFLPSGGQNGRVDRQTMDIESKRVVEGR
ncbi:MAG TPA: ABC transporter permease, partial [Gemmatimonadaceae bacterium]|nr:ABC transporter permease [Gemmatimonadaceae bacterium]